MKILVDMNLSPGWVDYLVAAGFDAVHWATIGDHRAADTEIMAYARDHGFVIFTHDLDFSSLLSIAGAAGPSVIQARTQAVLPDDLGARLIRVLRDHERALLEGAIVTIDLNLARLRLLPLRRSTSGS